MKKRFKVHTKDEVKEWYQRKDIVQNYMNGKFESTMGALTHKKQIDAIKKEIKRIKAKHIMDIACGPARLSKDIRGSFRGLAVDCSDEMLKLAKRRLKESCWKVKKMDAFNIKNMNKKFDLILTFRFLRHFDSKERKQLYKNINYLLKDNGILIFDVANKKKWDSVRKLSQSLRREDIVKVFDKLYYKNEVKRELKDNGFAVIKMIPVLDSYLIQYLISIFGKWTLFLVEIIEMLGGNDPWEWIVICKKKNL